MAKKNKLFEANFGIERRTYRKSEKNDKMLDYIEHISRYIFASSFVKNKIILDVACGTGYGSNYLLNFKPKLVIGMDNSKEAINVGKKTFKNESLNFIMGSGTKMGYENNSFDAVISFETIEHIPNYEEFISEIQRVLKKDGFFIISTPNYDAFSGCDKFYNNKYHVKEFTISEFYFLLQQYFNKVELYGESPMGYTYKILRNIRRLVFNLLKIDIMQFYKIFNRIPKKIDKSGSIYSLKNVSGSTPKFLIAVCDNKSH